MTCSKENQFEQLTDNLVCHEKCDPQMLSFSSSHAIDMACCLQLKGEEFRGLRQTLRGISKKQFGKLQKSLGENVAATHSG